MTGVLMKEDRTYRNTRQGGRRPGDDGGRDWGDTIARSAKDFWEPLEARRQAWNG
jgi:hypothetical protein